MEDHLEPPPRGNAPGPAKKPTQRNSPEGRRFRSNEERGAAVYSELIFPALLCSIFGLPEIPKSAAVRYVVAFFGLLATHKTQWND